MEVSHNRGEPAEIAAGRNEPDEVATVVRVLEEFRRLDPDMPIQYALSFLTIAQHEGLSMGDLAQRLGIAQSSASRNIAALSKWHSFGKEGHELVEAHEDPRERRRKLVSLTARGRRLISVLKSIVAGDPAAMFEPGPAPAPARRRAAAPATLIPSGSTR